jgi:SAM-dependent methyltransferase
MRNEPGGLLAQAEATAPRRQDEGSSGTIPYDAKEFFESFYKATVRGEPADWMTIGATTESEARFHYNAVENSIIRALARLEPLPRGAAVMAWRMLQQRRSLRVLDVGSGTGHWIDFFREVLFAAEVIGVEMIDQMADHLRRKYAGQESVTILKADIVEHDLASQIGAPVDYVSAIGVMFHIVEDARWERAVANLAAALKPGGLMFVGGDFGPRTRDAQRHAIDRFQSWQEHNRAMQSEGSRRVNKRVRSLAAWHGLIARCGLEMVDLVRSDREPGIMTPENDLLVVRRTR